MPGKRITLSGTEALNISEVINPRIDIGPVNAWLDIGTGNGRLAQRLKWNATAKLKVACDRVFGFTCELQQDWRKFTDLDTALSFTDYDLVTLMDVIEHLPKEDGTALLVHLMQMRRPPRIVVFTPRGFLRQDETTHPQEMRDNPYMKHVCGWTARELEQLGFDTWVLERFHNPQGVKGKKDAILGVWSP